MNITGQDVEQLGSTLATETFVDNAVSAVVTNVDGGSVDSTYLETQNIDGGNA